MKILLKIFEGSSMSLELPAGSQIDIINLWRKRIVTDILILAYLNKQVTLITIKPDKNSVGNEFQNEKLSIGDDLFLVNSMVKCNYTNLSTIGSSYDIELGLLVISSQALESLSKNSFVDFFYQKKGVLMDGEILYCTNDGYVINWRNFGIDLADLILSIKFIMKIYKLELSIVT